MHITGERKMDIALRIKELDGQGYTFYTKAKGGKQLTKLVAAREVWSGMKVYARVPGQQDMEIITGELID